MRLFNLRMVLIEARVPSQPEGTLITVSTQSTPQARAKITPAGKSPCEVARELRDQAHEPFAMQYHIEIKRTR
jgi:hypothetical protein